ncbi:unnamed protein product [Pedinophyceae sp. YPF-701]|nr:unnamed protein product [Pedinophyceae sp. YPF-701]
MGMLGSSSRLSGRAVAVVRLPGLDKLIGGAVPEHTGRAASQATDGAGERGAPAGTMQAPQGSGVPRTAFRLSPGSKGGSRRGSAGSSSQRSSQGSRGHATQQTSARGSGREASTSSAPLRRGRLVEWSGAGDQHIFGLAVLTREDPQHRWEAVAADGSPLLLSARDITLVLPGDRYRPEDAVKVWDEASQQDPDALAAAWETLSAQGSPSVGAEDVARVLFQSDDASAVYAAHRMLAADRIFFSRASRRRPGGQYRPRTPTQVAAQRRRAQAQAARAEKLKAFVQTAQAAAFQPWGSKPTASDWHHGPHADVVAALVDLALEKATPADGSAAQLAVAALHALGFEPTPNAAACLLEGVGVFRRNEELPVLRAGITRDFPAELEAAAAELAHNPPPDPDAAQRRDLRALPAVTIDSISTSEIDDGLSCELLPDGGARVWVHVADPTRYIEEGSPLDLEARRRSTTMYLPTGIIPMFPLCLAAGPFSLRAGVDSCALSLAATLAPDGSLAKFEVVPSTVHVDQRLTYDDVDALLADGEGGEVPEGAKAVAEELRTLMRLADLRRAWRKSQGAVDVFSPESEVRVVDAWRPDPEVTIQAWSADTSPSRRLVMEMMVLAGEVTAMAGARLGLPLPYRGHLDPVLPSAEELRDLPEGVCRSVYQRRFFTRSLMSTSAVMRHGALGLPGYVQCTSPIRRYPDMLAHFQLKAALRAGGGAAAAGAVRFTAEELERIVDEVGREAKFRAGVSSEVTAQWVAEYMSRRLEMPLRGMIVGWVDETAGRALVLLTDLGQETVVPIQRAGARIGEKILVTPLAADPKAGTWEGQECG